MRELNGKVSEIILRYKAPEVITKQPLKQNNDPPKISENEDKFYMMSKHMEKFLFHYECSPLASITTRERPHLITDVV